VTDAAHAVAMGSYGLIYLETPRLKTKMYHWPLAAKVTYKRSKGVAKFTLWGRVTVGKYYAPLVPVSLQESTNGKKWKTIGKYTTNADAWVSRTFKVKAKRTRYYRWTVAGTTDYASCTASKQKVTVK
jgi:hypothetical protein